MQEVKPFMSHSDIIHEYTRIFNEFGETERCSYRMDDILNSISDDKRKIWSIIFNGIKHKNKKEYRQAYKEFCKLDEVIKTNKLLYCFVMKEKIFSYAFIDEINVSKSIELYNKLIAIYENDKNVNIQLQVASIMMCKDFILGKVKKDDDCLLLEDTIIKKYQRINKECFIITIVKAMRNKAYTLECLNRNSESRDLYKYLIETYKNHDDIAVQLLVAQAMTNLGLDLSSNILGKEGPPDETEKNNILESVNIFEEIIVLYTKSKSVMLHLKIINAMYFLGCYHDKLGNNTKAIETFNTLLRKYKRLMVSERPDIFKAAKQELFAAVMCFSGDNENNFDELVEQIKTNRVIPFVGAGLSAFLGYPLWGDFLFDIYDNKIFPADKANLPRENFANIKHEDQSQYLYELRGSANFIRDIESAFTDRRLNYYVNRYKTVFYGESASILPSLFNDIVLTTNFDNIIEEVYLMNKKKVQLCLPNDREKLSRTIQSGGHGDCILCKLHGTIDTPESIVLTKSDYDKVYSEDAPLTKTLEICMKGKNLLFLGCSLKEDRTMDFLKSVYEKGIYHYAVFPSKEDKIGETSRYLGNKSILSILFPEGCFECVAVILETINDLVEYERSKEAVVRISKYYGIDVSDIMKMIDKKRKPVDMNDIADQAKGEKTIDINKLIEQAKDMQEKVSIAQEELENRFVQGTDEDKLIEVEMSCTKSIKKITIDETLLSPGQKQNLENQMVEAFMDAKDKADEIAVSAMEEATGGLVLPNI